MFYYRTGSKLFWSALHLHGLATVLVTQSCIRPGGCPPDPERKPKSMTSRQKSPCGGGGEGGI